MPVLLVWHVRSAAKEASVGHRCFCTSNGRQLNAFAMHSSKVGFALSVARGFAERLLLTSAPPCCCHPLVACKMALPSPWSNRNLTLELARVFMAMSLAPSSLFSGHHAQGCCLVDAAPDRLRSKSDGVGRAPRWAKPHLASSASCGEGQGQYRLASDDPLSTCMVVQRVFFRCRVPVCYLLDHIRCCSDGMSRSDRRSCSQRGHSLVGAPPPSCRHLRSRRPLRRLGRRLRSLSFPLSFWSETATTRLTILSSPSH